jgi:hypothetical protein
MKHLDPVGMPAKECNCMRMVRFQREHAANRRPPLALVGNEVPFLCLRVQLGNKLIMARPGLTDAFRPHGSQVSCSRTYVSIQIQVGKRRELPDSCLKPPRLGKLPNGHAGRPLYQASPDGDGGGRRRQFSCRRRPRISRLETFGAPATRCGCRRSGLCPGRRPRMIRAWNHP